MNRQKRRTTRKDQEGEKVVQLETFRRVLPLAAILLLDSSLLGAGESVISKVPDSTGKFCHLKFPAIKEETLYWDRPVLKDPSQGDIIDFYGPCSHDPLGRKRSGAKETTLTAGSADYLRVRALNRDVCFVRMRWIDDVPLKGS